MALFAPGIELQSTSPPHTHAQRRENGMFMHVGAALHSDESF